jgi:hypothetical protein
MWSGISPTRVPLTLAIAVAIGGAIVSYGPMDIRGSLLENNRADNGGALYPRWANARMTIFRSVLRNNRARNPAQGWGGAILAWDGAPVSVEASDIYGNTAFAGGGIYNFGNSLLILSGGTRLRENVAEHWGGGVLNKSGMVALDGAILSDNSAAYGGGIENDGTATLLNVTLSGNRATDSGGGLDNWGSAALTNTTLSGNGATYGGGIENAAWSEATLLNVALSGNAATYGGGIDGDRNGRLTVRNTIVVDSPGGGNCSGRVKGSICPVTLAAALAMGGITSRPFWAHSAITMG